jgi:hypothetical protein
VDFFKESTSFQNHSYWLNHLNAAKSDPTSWKCGLVRGPHVDVLKPRL